MEMIAKLLRVKKRLRENSCTNLIWLINFLPKTAGFSIFNEKETAIFWIIHITLAVYVYIVGTVVYQMYYIDGFLDAVNSCFNVPIVVTILSDTMWFILKRDKIKTVLNLSLDNDSFIINTRKYIRMLRNIKIIVLTCYIFHLVNDVFIFIPSRVSDMKSFSIANCVGLEPITKTPNKEICMLLLASQEITSSFVVAGYDAIILFLFSHTTAVFLILSEDMESFRQITKEYTQDQIHLVTSRLKNLIMRHSLILHTIHDIQDLFTLVIGMGFFLNAVSLCMFFVLPTEVCLNFGPLIYYYLAVFFLYCYQGQRLTNASERFERAVYCCGWEHLDVKEQKSVLMILRQAQKPVMLRAGKIVPICMFTFAAPFWIIHCSLLFYVYGMGIALYQIKFARGAEDFIKSYVNVSLLILIGNISFWWLRKRPILRKMVKILEKSDVLARNNPIIQKSYNRRTIIIKLIVCAFYTSQITDASLIYIPHRVDVLADYSMVPCVGMGDLSKSPNREICISILLVQELTIMSVCLNYQMLLLTLIAHTATMYHMLSLEILTFNDCKDLGELKKLAKELLPAYIRRHVLILDAFENLKSLYSLPIGVDFGSNAVCMALFFYLSLSEWLKFIPVLVYCFLVFFLYCFLCQKLTDAAEEFEKAVYGCGWDSFDVKERKLVYVMLRQAQKPVILLAADIIPVNIYTFATTLQAMFKFVTVIKF